MTEPSTGGNSPLSPRAASPATGEDGGPAPRNRKLIAIIGGGVLACLVVVALIATSLMHKPTAAPPVVASVSPESSNPPTTPTVIPSPTVAATTSTAAATPPPVTVTPVAVPKLGDCVKAVQKTSGAPKYEKTSCDAKGALLYQVAKVGQGAVECPQSETRPYSVTMLRGKDDKPAGYLCLALRLRKDACYSFASGNAEVACTDAAAQVKVTQVLNSGDVNQCKPKGIAYPELKMAYCLDDTRK